MKQVTRHDEGTRTVLLRVQRAVEARRCGKLVSLSGQMKAVVMDGII